ncbi:hypothetical protein SMA90_24720 [Escherichia coli]|jgi:hypothetical protein
MKRLTTLTALILALFWTGCTPHDAVGDIVPEYFVEELNVWDFTIRDAVDALLKELEIDQSDPMVSKVLGFIEGYLNKEIRGVALSYRTFDPFGNPVLATGAFFYPRDLKPKGIVEIPPIAHLDRGASAAIYVGRKRFFEEAFPCMLNYITINADLLGVLYTQEMPRPFLHDANSGLVAYHMRKAVEEYLLITENYRLGNRSSVFGYSLGGASAMSIAKYYTENQTGIKIDQVFTGGGVYDGLEAFRAYARTEKSDYLAIPSVIIAMDTFYELNLDYSKIFANGMENSVNSPNPAEGGDGYAYWFDGTHSSGSIHRRWGSDLRNYMHEDFFHQEPHGEFLKLQECMHINSLVYNWTPDPLLNIRMIHSSEDNLIPVDCADLLYKVYKEKGCAIQYIRTTGNHYEAGTEFMMTAMLYLLMR